MTDTTETNYPARYAHLNGAIGRLAKKIPEPLGAFMTLQQKAIAQGALSPSAKELIALGIAIGVAILMGGGPSLMYGTEVFEALEQFQAAEAA